MNELHVAIYQGSCRIDFKTLEADQTIIGRSPNCGIRLCDPAISRRHALLQRSGLGVWRIRDLQSLNGTIVGGVLAVGDVPLCDGVEIELMPFRLKVFLTRPAPAALAVCEDESTQKSHPQANPGLGSCRKWDQLTPAQNSVCALLVQGLLEKQAARRLGISVHTVHVHAKAIYKLLSVSNRVELILLHGQPLNPFERNVDVEATNIFAGTKSLETPAAND